MPQFSVYRNVNPDTKSDYPFLLDVQSDLIQELATRVVIPLSPAAAMKGKSMRSLTPLLEIEGKRYVVMTPLLAGIGKKQMGPVVTDLSSRRDEIIAALDLLITGI
jgi:toxin CcdB